MESGREGRRSKKSRSRRQTATTDTTETPRSGRKSSTLDRDKTALLDPRTRLWPARAPNRAWAACSCVPDSRSKMSARRLRSLVQLFRSIGSKVAPTIAAISHIARVELGPAYCRAWWDFAVQQLCGCCLSPGNNLFFSEISLGRGGAEFRSWRFARKRGAGCRQTTDCVALAGNRDWRADGEHRNESAPRTRLVAWPGRARRAPLFFLRLAPAVEIPASVSVLRNQRRLAASSSCKTCEACGRPG